jgi:2-iminobutanoate/2-iminopropanoate deaminase
MKEIILTDAAPAPIGPYSQAIRFGAYLFCSGQVALDPKTGNMKNASIEEETRQALANLSEVLKAGGTSLSNVIKTTIFLVDMNDFATVNTIYGEAFDSAKPARSTVAVAALPKGARVEIEAIATISPA